MCDRSNWTILFSPLLELLLLERTEGNFKCTKRLANIITCAVSASVAENITSEGEEIIDLKV